MNYTNSTTPFMQVICARYALRTLTALAFATSFAATPKEGDYNVRGRYHGQAHVNTL